MILVVGCLKQKNRAFGCQNTFIGMTVVFAVLQFDAKEKIRYNMCDGTAAQIALSI